MLTCFCFPFWLSLCVPPRLLYSCLGLLFRSLTLFSSPRVHIYLLDSCSIHTLAHLLELSSVLHRSVFLVVIVSCLSFMLSTLHCTSYLPLSVAISAVFQSQLSLSYFWPRLLWAGDQAVHQQTHLPPLTPQLAGQAPSTHTHFLYLPSYLGYHGFVSACLPQETPFELEPQDAGKIYPTSPNPDHGYRSPSLLPAPPFVFAASTVLAVVFTPISS